MGLGSVPELVKGLEQESERESERESVQASERESVGASERESGPVSVQGLEREW